MNFYAALDSDSLSSQDDDSGSESSVAGSEKTAPAGLDGRQTLDGEGPDSNTFKQLLCELLDAHPEGILSAQLPSAYKEYHGEPLPLTKEILKGNGCKTLKQFLARIPSVVTLEITDKGHPKLYRTGSPPRDSSDLPQGSWGSRPPREENDVNEILGAVA